MTFTLRKQESEERYMQHKDSGLTKPLELEPSLKQWTYWRLINNRYPYDSVFEVHHMLIPSRSVSSDRELTAAEKAELENILHNFVEQNYHIYFVNTRQRRSNHSMYHIHVARFLAERPTNGN
jgi:diadenosine tetraphosphate (Ap4A) HIT family hydrolase